MAAARAPAPVFALDLTRGGALNRCGIRWRARILVRVGSHPKRFGYLRVICTEFGKVDVTRILRQDIEDWLEESGWSPRTRKNYVVTLTTILNFAVGKGCRADNPAATIDRPILDDRPVGPDCGAGERIAARGEGVRSRHAACAGDRSARCGRHRNWRVAPGNVQEGAPASRRFQYKLSPILESVSSSRQLSRRCRPRSHGIFGPECEIPRECQLAGIRPKTPSTSGDKVATNRVERPILTLPRA